MVTLVAPRMIEPFLTPHLPPQVKPLWFADLAEALTHAPHADIGWFDIYPLQDRIAVTQAATNLKWLTTMSAGLDSLPHQWLMDRNVAVTFGGGLNAVPVADYAVMGVLVLAKGFANIVRAHDRKEWLKASPGTGEPTGARALIIGYGTIGQLIGDRLRAFDMHVTGVRRSGEGADILGPDAWRARLNEYDWVILAAPGTSETQHMIGKAELAAMKPSAGLINVGRGELVDQDALADALEAGTLGGAFLDVTDPEPLPPEHRLWSAPNCIITMHMSGMSQTSLFPKAIRRFLDNLDRYIAGETLMYQVDLQRGY